MERASIMASLFGKMLSIFYIYIIWAQWYCTYVYGLMVWLLRIYSFSSISIFLVLYMLFIFPGCLGNNKMWIVEAILLFLNLTVEAHTHAKMSDAMVSYKFVLYSFILVHMTWKESGKSFRNGFVYILCIYCLYI